MAVPLTAVFLIAGRETAACVREVSPSSTAMEHQALKWRIGRVITTAFLLV